MSGAATIAACRAGNLAVVTGGASGIGFAAAGAFRDLGMRVCLLDRAGDALAQAAERLGAEVTAFPLDVADRASVEAVAAGIASEHGAVSVLMNNAGVGSGGDVFAAAEAWEQVLGVNLMGVLHGVQSFVPAMVAGDAPGVVINTGSKQGITQPPGNTAYNVSKAGVKALTEGLAHSLREQTAGRISAHLLIPGFTYTRMTTGQLAGKPPGAWTAEQVVDFMMRAIAAGDFYILCPDNETSTEQDRRRIRWAAEDIAQNRPALSRWHPDWREAFARHMAE